MPRRESLTDPERRKLEDAAQEMINEGGALRWKEAMDRSDWESTVFLDRVKKDDARRKRLDAMLSRLELILPSLEKLVAKGNPF